MMPSSTALSGAPTASSVPLVWMVLSKAIIGSKSDHLFQPDLMQRQLQAIFPAIGALSVVEVAKTALELWSISLADKAEERVSWGASALDFGALDNPVKIESCIDLDLLGATPAMTCPVHTCPGRQTAG